MMNVKQKAKTIKALADLLPDYSSNAVKTGNVKAVMDGSNCCMVINKVEDSLLNDFQDADSTLPTTPTLEYDVKARFSVEFLEKMVKIMKASGDKAVTLFAKTDYPLKLEGEQFVGIIAPRVND